MAEIKKCIKRRLLFFIALNVSVLIFSIIYDLLFDRSIIGKCVFLSVMGFYCPGCGGSRSLNALLEFRLLKSFIYYPPILITSLILLYTDTRILISILKNEEKIRGVNYRIFIIIPVSIIAQFVIKNLLLLFGIDLLGNVL